MTTKSEITIALKCAAVARADGKIKVAEAWEAIAEALRLGTMSIDEALERAIKAIDRGDLEEANACGFIGRTLSQGKPRIAEAWERIARAQTVLEAIEAKAQLAANLAWGEGKVKEALAWEEAAREWSYGDSVAAEVWERAVESGGTDSEITEIIAALKRAIVARADRKIKVAEAWEFFAEALRLDAMSIHEAVVRVTNAIDRAHLEESNAYGFIGRIFSQDKPRIAEAWERIAKAQTVLEAIEAKAQLAANLAWSEGKVEEALAWEEAAREWSYGDSVAAELWERVAESGRYGYDALAYKARIEGSYEEADAWDRAETARITGDAEAAGAWACVAKVRGGDISRAEVASVWTKASQTWAKTVAAELMRAAESLRAKSPSAFCTAEALEAWEHALEARDDGKIAVAVAWACAAAAWVLSNCRREEDAKAWEQVAIALTNGNAELADAWERTATAWAMNDAKAALESEREALIIEARLHAAEAREEGKPRRAEAWEKNAIALAGRDNEAAVAWEEIARDLYE